MEGPIKKENPIKKALKKAGMFLGTGAILTTGFGEAVSQENKKEPLIVYDENDPRLKVYKDALNAYKYYQNKFKLAQKDPSLVIEEVPEELNSKTILIDGGYMSFSERYEKEFGIKPISLIKICHRGKNQKSNCDDYDFLPVFKEPVQKVIYRKSEKRTEGATKEKTQMEIDKSGLFTMPDGKKYTYEQLIDSFPKMKQDLIFKQNFPGRERPKTKE